MGRRLAAAERLYAFPEEVTMKKISLILLATIIFFPVQKVKKLTVQSRQSL